MKKIKALTTLVLSAVLTTIVGCSSQSINYEAKTLLKNIESVRKIYDLKPGDSYHVFVPEKRTNFFCILINREEEGGIRTRVIIYEDPNRNGYYERRRIITPLTPEELEKELEKLFKKQTPRQEVPEQALIDSTSRIGIFRKNSLLTARQ